MSNAVTDQCRPLKLPPTAKAVLMALADYADDAGLCWPSILSLCEWTCLSERAVRNAIRDLERAGHVSSQVSFGRSSNRYTVRHNPAANAGFNSARHGANPAGDAPFNPASDDNPAPCAGLATRHLTTSTRHLTTPTRHLVPSTRHLVPPNHQEPPVKQPPIEATTKKRASAPTPLCPDGVDPQTWTDWLALRKAKRAPVTETVLRDARRESEKAGVTLTRFLEIWCARGSQGLQADWLKPNERAGPAPPAGRPSAAENFRGKTYGSTNIDSLPADLRDAAIAALAADG